MLMRKCACERLTPTHVPHQVPYAVKGVEAECRRQNGFNGDLEPRRQVVHEAHEVRRVDSWHQGVEEVQ